MLKPRFSSTKLLSNLLTVALLLSVLLVALPPALAQTDTDGDGLTDTADRCPTEAGPRENNGCPIASTEPTAVPPTTNDADGDTIPDDADRCPFVSGQGNQFGGVSGPDGCPVDSDGDTIVDGLDRCPFEAGVPEREGCPAEQPPQPQPTATEPPRETVNQPTLPEDERCLLATRNPERINVRRFPELTAEIVGQLSPEGVYVVLQKLETFEGLWYRLELGWVFGEVVRVGGRCSAGLDERPSVTEPTLAENNAEICQGFVGLTPLDELYVNMTYFEWSPLAVPELAWYELTLYNTNADWVAGVGKGPGEPYVTVDTSPAAIGNGTQFFWQVTAYSNQEQIMCQTPLYPVTRTNKAILLPAETPEPCDTFAGVTPLETLNLVSTPFEWTALSGILYYDLRLYDANDALVQQSYSVQVNTVLATSSAAIGDGGAWSWEVSAYSNDYQLVCSTPRYPVTRSNEGPSIGMPPVDDPCLGFAALYPTETDVISPAPYELTQFSWSAGAGNLLYMPILHNDDVNFTYSLPGYSPATTQNMPTGVQVLGAGENIWWEVVAVDAVTVEEVCRTPKIPLKRATYIPVIDPSKIPDLEIRFPSRGISLENINLDLFRLWACQDFYMLTFSDSLEWTQFHWTQIPSAAAYRVNIYDANQQWIEGFDTSGYTAILVTKLNQVGAKDSFWFDVQALNAEGKVLCTTARHFAERNFDDPNLVSFDPDLVIKGVGGGLEPDPNGEVEAVVCNGIEIITPSGQLPDDGGYNTYFEWTPVAGAYTYVVNFYDDQNQWVNGSFTYVNYGPYLFFDPALDDSAPGSKFYWEVVAWDFNNNKLCASPLTEIIPFGG